MNYKIKELMNVYRGASPRPIIEYVNDKGYRWLKISDFKMYDRYVYDTKEYIIEEGLKKTRYMPKGTLILTNSATPGIPIFLGNDMCLHDGFLYFQNINCDIINIKFLYYWFLYNREKIVKQANGSVFQNLKKEIVEDLEIDVPNMTEQLKIVKMLESINNKIDTNNKINDNLYELIEIQYNKFISNIDEFELVKLKDIANVSSGKRPKIKGNEFDIPLIGASGIMAYTDNYNFNEDILIIGRVGTLGVVQRYFDKIWASDNTLTIKTQYGCNIECYLKTVDYISLNRGSTQPLITQTDISNLVIKFNKVKFEEFEKEIEPLRYKIYKNELQNKTLEQLRDTLLPKLMNGEIDLDIIEI